MAFKHGRVILLFALAAAMRCEMPHFPRTEPFEPDVKILDAEVQEFYRKERARDADGLLRHWEPCAENYEADLSPVRIARSEVRVRLAAPPPEYPRCTYKTDGGYGSEGRFLRAYCRVSRGGIRSNETLKLVGLYPSLRKKCVYQFLIFGYSPKLPIPD
jgi:hypothetical protein